MLTAYTHINAAIYSLSFPFRLIHIRYTRTKRTQATFYLKAVVFITNRTMCNAVAFFAERKVSVRARRGKSRRNSYDIQLAAVRHASVCASVNDCAQVWASILLYNFICIQYTSILYSTGHNVDIVRYCSTVRASCFVCMQLCVRVCVCFSSIMAMEFNWNEVYL